MTQVIKDKKGGPYSKSEQEKRRNEVYRLHFEYGYSARKIASLMEINRNTINRDLQYLYYQVAKDFADNPEWFILRSLERFEVQRTRLREQLNKTSSVKEKLAIERILYDIDSKIIQTNQRFSDSAFRKSVESTERLNQWLEKNNKDDRYITLFDKIKVSAKAHQRINKILKEEDRRVRFHT